MRETSSEGVAQRRHAECVTQNRRPTRRFCRFGALRDTFSQACALSEGCPGGAMKVWSCCVVLAAAACGGDKATAPIPCDTYHGGIVAVPDSLPGTYDLKSVCSGMKPDQAGASGSVILTGANFTASITSQGSTTNYSGTYATSNPDGITVTLTR